MDSFRQVAAWFAAEEGFALLALRPRKAKGLDEDVSAAVLFEPGSARLVADPRLSTTYTEAGRPIRAGVELWLETEPESDHLYPRRAVGQALGDPVDWKVAEVELVVQPFRWYRGDREGPGDLPAGPLVTEPTRAIISDFGGVLTSPLLDSFMAFQSASGIPLEELGKAMLEIATRDGANPLFELEVGRLTEAHFLSSLSQVLSRNLGREVQLESFGEQYFQNLPSQRRDDRLHAGPPGAGLPDGHLHQQRAGVGAPMAGQAARGGDLRRRRGLGVRRVAQARARNL